MVVDPKRGALCLTSELCGKLHSQEGDSVVWTLGSVVPRCYSSGQVILLLSDHEKVVTVRIPLTGHSRARNGEVITPGVAMLGGSDIGGEVVRS